MLTNHRDSNGDSAALSAQRDLPVQREQSPLGHGEPTIQQQLDELRAEVAALRQQVERGRRRRTWRRVRATIWAIREIWYTPDSPTMSTAKEGVVAPVTSAPPALAADGLSVPPEPLRYRVTGSRDADAFLRAGRQAREDIARALQSVGRDLQSCDDILDFGCGCGRALRYMPRTARLYGTDIDGEAITWCRENLTFASFSTNDPLPPSPFDAASFDLVYALSVFSHLNEEYQFQWLSELQRIAKPDGIVLVTVRGEYYLDQMPPEHRQEVESKGFEFVESDFWKGIFPDWYHTTHHTRKYVETHYSRYFDVLDYIPRGLEGVQDIVLLRKR